ncbi:DUF3857 domain-containing protein [Emticicia sp. C21]|uniref:DUF3857 domain-containing protein n=1 Tax=Emticicia sp. C21 TaxID=2302915 RepID=UPI000E341FD9|nr:DUF3857 domain-containing protein [Emticicia sp. C21]RFS14665.1 DUF3857 domain-containing protein [Emticicia sp. C21]
MKKIAVLLLLTTYSHFISAQLIPEPKVKFGEYNMEDVTMKSYAKDSSVDAVVLYDYGSYEYDFNSGLTVNYIFHQRIKILRKSGLRWASINIPFFWDSNPDKQEIVKDIKGFTYNLEDGGVVVTELKKTSVFEEKSSSKYRDIKIAFPQVKEGSVIELTYKIQSPLWYYLRTWKFQKSIPVVWSAIKAIIPGYFDFKLTYFGFQPFAIKEVKDGKSVFWSRSDERGRLIEDPYLSYHFAMQDVPAIREDDYMTTVEDYRSSIHFELAKTIFPTSGERNYSITYNDVTKTLLEYPDFGVALRKFGKTARKISADILAQSNTKDTLTLVSAAYEHIRNTITWNGENRLMATEKLEDVYEKKSGNSAEINLILVGVLQELGFDANPVVLSTRANGKLIPDIALLDRFNYSIAQLVVNGKDFLLDATDRYVKMNMLPKRCLNERGWLISKKPRWVSLTPTNKKQTTTFLTFSIEEEQQLKGQFFESYLGYASTEKKAEIERVGQDKYMESLKNIYPSFEDPIFTYKENEAKEARIECETKVNEAYTIAGERIFIQPLLWKTQQVNPFTKADRQYPVDLGYNIQELVIAKYTLPVNYSVESMPASISVTLPENKGRYQYTIKAENGKVEVMSQFTLVRPIFSADDYITLRELYTRMIAKQNEQIVLKKN